MSGRPRVQSFLKDIIVFALIVAFPWGLAVNRDFHSGWFVFACIITPVMVVAFVLRQLGIIPLNSRRSQ